MSVVRFFRRRDWDDERRRELESYVEIETDANLARGFPPEEARGRALRKLGNATLVREEIYRMNTVTWLESLWQDVRFGARLLRRSPGFTAVALLSLALGIGANGAIFQLLDIVGLRALPLRDPGSFVEIRFAPESSRTGAFTGTRPILTHPLWEEIRRGNSTVLDLFAYGNVGFDLSAGGESRFVEGMFVSGGYFRGLEGSPVVGRLIEAQDDVRGCTSPGAVLGYPFWQREFGGDPEVTARTIRLDGAVLPIIGVVGQRFSGVDVGRRVDVFVPLCARPAIKRAAPALDRRDFWWLAAFGRLAPGATIEQATAELASRSAGIMAATLPPTYAASDVRNYEGLKLQVYDASTGVSSLRSRYAGSLSLLLAIAGLVLLIACANLANLMLARGSARAREIAVRLAIGASRRRVFRQLVAESLLLGMLGAAAGIVVALLLSRALVTVLTSYGGPWTLDLRLDWRLSAFTLILAALTSVLFGLMPALRSTRVPPGAAMVLHSRGQTMDRGRFLLRRGLVAGQVAISLVLVVAALLLVGTLRNLASGDYGFNDREVLVANLDLRPAGVATDALLTFKSDLVARLDAVPGVTGAAAAEIVPVSGSGWNQTVFIDGQRQEGHPNANRVSAGFFDALDIAFIEGRNFDRRDHAGSPAVAIVNKAFAAKYFPGASPIGRTFKMEMGPGEPDPSYQIVGVVGDTKYSDLRSPLGPIMYFPDTQETAPQPFLSVLLRTRGDPDALRPLVTRTISEAHPGVSISLESLRTQVDRSLLRERLVAALAAGFAVLAVILAAAGLYGVMSYGVARRRHEIGIRVALGASRTGIVAMVVREVAVLVAIGLAIGLVLAVLAARTASTLLYGVEPTAAGPLAAAGAALVIIAALASLAPAHRAARLSPTTALRTDA
jgi:predicted permease